MPLVAHRFVHRGTHRKLADASGSTPATLPGAAGPDFVTGHVILVAQLSTCHVQQHASARPLRLRAYKHVQGPPCVQDCLSKSAWPHPVNCQWCVLAVEQAAVPTLATWPAVAGQGPQSLLCCQLLHCFAACWLQAAAAASLAVVAVAVYLAADPATAEKHRTQEQGHQPGAINLSVCG